MSFKQLVLLIAGCAVLWVFLVAVAGGPREPTSSDWRVVGRIDDQYRFVTVTRGLETRRQVYNDVAEKLCGLESSPMICGLAFFAEGDSVPATQSRGQFWSGGGFKGYRLLAHYWRNRNTGMAEFTGWDCERAGIEGSPLSSLCDPVVSATHKAAMALGTRTGFIRGCGWPETGDAGHFAAFLSTVPDPEKRAFYREAFDVMNSGNGPDDRANCFKLRTDIDDRARAARQTLGIPQPVTMPTPDEKPLQETLQRLRRGQSRSVR